MTEYFKDLNALLESMQLNSSHDFATTSNLIQVGAMTSDKQKLQKLRRIRITYSRLVRLSRYWAKLNAVPIVSSVVDSLFTLVLLSQGVYGVLYEPKYIFHGHMTIVRTLLWIIFWIGKLLIIVHSAAALASEAKRTCEILLTHLHQIEYIRFEVHAFALQLIQSPLRLSAGGLFDLDNSLLQMVITTVCTYLIVLLQTRNSP